MQGTPPEQDACAERLTRLEEAAGFMQHDLDGLSSSVRELFDAVAALRKRLDAVEGRVGAIEQGDPDEAAD